MEKTVTVDSKECKIFVDFDSDSKGSAGVTDRLFGNAIREAISDKGYNISASIDGTMVSKRGNLDSKNLAGDLAITASELFLKAMGIPAGGVSDADPRQMLKELGFN